MIFMVPMHRTQRAGKNKYRDMAPRFIAGFIAGVVVAGAVVAVAVAYRPAIAAIEPPAPQSFDPALVKRGRELAAMGNCNDCHTQRGGKAFSGGVPVPTPFGTIYSSNITPDPDTGIGRWSEEAFRRAMRSASTVMASICIRPFPTITSPTSPMATTARSTPS